MDINMIKKTIVPPMFIAMALGLSGCVIHVGGHADDGDVSSVFGGIDIRDGRSVGELSTVNGGIELGNKVTAEEVSTVNGGIEMGDDVTIDEAEAVNGDIEAGKNLSVRDSIETVNGDINLGKGADIGDDVETVNGDISLESAKVGGDIETINGDITLEDDTEVNGNIVYEEQSSRWGGKSNPPTLRIEDGVSVHGKIILKREVELEIPSYLEEKVERDYDNY